MSSDSSFLRLIDREIRQIEIESKGIVQRFPLKPIPDDLYEILASAVDLKGDPVTKLNAIYASPFLKPTLCTFNFDTPFLVNAATKVVRLTLKDDVIEDKIENLEGDLLSLQGLPFEETIEDRIEMYRNLFVDDKKIDRFRFGTAEIFGEATYANIRRDPRACLLFYWPDNTAGVNRSYQINVIAEIVPPGDPYFRYMRVVRALFSSRFIDIQRDSYVAAYKFWVSDILDKSLASKLGFIRDSNNS